MREQIFHLAEVRVIAVRKRQRRGEWWEQR